MGYMRTLSIRITDKHPLFDYCDRITRLSNNLSNAVRFRQRQVITAVSKDEADWSANERRVMDEIRDVLPYMKKDPKMPSGKDHFLGYTLMDAILKHTCNPDYYAEGLPRQSAQGIIKQCVSDMKAFYRAVREYSKCPDSFTGKPELPGYKRKGGRCTAFITNQDCKVMVRGGKWYAVLPFAKQIPLCLGAPIIGSVLKQVCIVPENIRFCIRFQFEVGKELPDVNENPERISAIDFGVDNLMSVTNNCGLPCLIYKGGAVKSANQLYNKQIAKIMSGQTAGTTNKFVPTPEYYRFTNLRNDRISDCLHKYAKAYITWCVENRIDTIVMGSNHMWKQESDLGSRNNQNFVQLPINQLQGIISYLASWNGIRVVEQEESYTSKASFLDMDPIPVYKKEDDTKYVFSGKRRPIRYAGIYKKDGFRGLYVAKDGSVINSDLNGSANIMRKAFPDAFKKVRPDFNNVTVIRHPDLKNREENRKKQLARNTGPSKSKQKRQRRKSLTAA